MRRERVLLFCLLAFSDLAWGYYNASSEYSSGALGGSPYQTFQSTDLTPVTLNFNVFPATTPQSGYLFYAPRGTAVKQPGGQIIDWEGNLIYDASAYGQTMSFQQMSYQGEDVLGMWVGAFNSGGWGDGYSILLDRTYTQIANITTTLANCTNDFHEFQITSNNTALITIYSVEQYDLSSYNVTATDGSSGWIIAGYAQEINVTSGEAIFTWKSLDHVDPSLCYASPGSTGVSESSPWDYFHINSIEKDSSGNYLISSRHCHAIYYVSGADGSIIWTLNGMNSSFTMGEGSTFEWQHHARWTVEGQQMTIFDNAATAWVSNETEARGLLVNIDTSSMSATLAQAYLPWNATVSESQGSVQTQPNGNVLLGWGQTPFFGEYDSNGTLLWSAQFGVGDVQSYRVLRSNWTGYPTWSPSISVVSNSSTSSHDVYASWNGATEVSTWEILGSASQDGTYTSLVNSTKEGFETLSSIPQSQTGAYSFLQVRGVAANGTVLAPAAYAALNGTVLSSTSTSTSAAGASATSASSAAQSAKSSAAGRSEQGMMGMAAIAAWSVVVGGAAVLFSHY